MRFVCDTVTLSSLKRCSILQKTIFDWGLKTSYALNKFSLNHNWKNEQFDSLQLIAQDSKLILNYMHHTSWTVLVL